MTFFFKMILMGTALMHDISKQFTEKFFRASGEAILGTLKMFLLTFSYVKFFRASGEATLGTLKYFSSRFLM